MWLYILHEATACLAFFLRPHWPYTAAHQNTAFMQAEARPGAAATVLPPSGKPQLDAQLAVLTAPESCVIDFDLQWEAIGPQVRRCTTRFCSTSAHTLLILLLYFQMSWCPCTLPASSLWKAFSRWFQLLLGQLAQLSRPSCCTSAQRGEGWGEGGGGPAGTVSASVHVSIKSCLHAC